MKIQNVKIKLFQNGAYDCTLNGVSKGKTDMFVILEASDEEIESFKASLDEYEIKKYLIRIDRILWGKPYPYLKPLYKPNFTHVGGMSGGNKAIMPNGEVLDIHDRFETPEEYEMYSS